MAAGADYLQSMLRSGKGKVSHITGRRYSIAPPLFWPAISGKADQ